MMQAFEVACAFCEQDLKRDLIIDASVYGIGRGAGNLNTEIFAKWANEKLGKIYNIEPLIDIYNDYIQWIYEHCEKWGYSIPYLITAKYNANPNFAGYYEKLGLSYDVIEKCISSLSSDEKIIFNKQIAAQKYDNYKSLNKNNKIKCKKNEYYTTACKLMNNKNLALILITANRATAVKGFLLGSAKMFFKLGIDLIVYDSSDNNLTKEVVDKFSLNYPNIHYDYWHGQYDGISIDEKVLSAYKKYSSKYKYLWATRDGLAIAIENMMDYLAVLMSLEKDLIVVDSVYRDWKHHGTKDYNDPALLFKEQCVHMNTLGTFIVNSNFIMNVIKEIPLDERTYGMYVPMAFFYYYEHHRINAHSYVGHLWKGNIYAAPSSFWTKKILWQWGERWYNMINNLPVIYNKYKPEVLKVETVDFKPFSFQYLAKAKLYGGLTYDIVSKYKDILPYVCDTPLWQFYLLAILPKSAASILGKMVVKYNKNINKKKLAAHNKQVKKYCRIRRKLINNQIRSLKNAANK